MINYPSQTLALQPFLLEKINRDITDTYVTRKNRGDIVKSGYVDRHGDYDIYELTPINTSVDTFVLPIAYDPMDENKDKDASDIIVDVRPFTRLDRMQNVVVNNYPEYYFNMDTAVLTRRWQDAELHVPQKLLLKVWAQWLGTNLITKLNIEPTLQPTVNIITAFYLYCMLNGIEGSINPSELRRMSVNIGYATYATNQTVLDVIDLLDEPITSLPGYIFALRKSGSNRFDKLTPGFIFSIVQFGWYGQSVARITGAALEFPPVFIAMVYSAIYQDAYNKTAIGRIIKNSNKSDVTELDKRLKKIIHG